MSRETCREATTPNSRSKRKPGRVVRLHDGPALHDLASTAVTVVEDVLIREHSAVLRDEPAVRTTSRADAHVVGLQSAESEGNEQRRVRT